MSRIHVYALSLFAILLGAGCTTLPQADSPEPVSAVPTESSSTQGPRPEATLEPPTEPISEPIRLAMSVPDPFRFDAGKKEALQKQKPSDSLRRPPTDTLPEPLGRQEPLSLGSSEMHLPLPPPKAPEITPIVPSEASAASESELRSSGGVEERVDTSAPQVARRPASGPEPSESEPARGPQGREDLQRRGDSVAREDLQRRGDSVAREDLQRRGDSVARGEPVPERGVAEQSAPERPDPREARSPVAEQRSEDSAGESSAKEEQLGQESRGFEGPGEAYPYELVESEEEVESAVGEELTVRLSGDGWLYLGEAGRSEAVRFISQRETDGETLFRFRIGRAGEYELQFQRQDLFSGRVSEHRLEVAAVDSVGEDVVVKPREEGGADGGSSGPGEFADRDDSRAEANGGVEIPEAEAIRWPEDFSTEALLQDPADSLRRARESETHDALTLAQLVARRGDSQGAMRLLEAYQRQEERELELDEVWFRMAGLLERERDARDLRRAVELYERIVDVYPLSHYYEASQQRVEYLKRHFLLVR